MYEIRLVDREKNSSTLRLIPPNHCIFPQEEGKYIFKEQLNTEMT